MDLFLKILLSGFILAFAGLLFVVGPRKLEQSQSVVEQPVMPGAIVEWTGDVPDLYTRSWVLVLPTGERVFVARSGNGLTSLLLPPLPKK